MEAEYETRLKSLLGQQIRRFWQSERDLLYALYDGDLREPGQILREAYQERSARHQAINDTMGALAKLGVTPDESAPDLLRIERILVDLGDLES